MARYTINHPDGSQSVVTRHHPFLRFLACLVGVVLVMVAILHNLWLLIPTVIIVVAALALNERSKGRKARGLK